MKLGRLVWVCIFALGGVALAGCQEVDRSTTYSFLISESLPDLSVGVSEGVQICQVDTSHCDITDSDGAAEVTVPFNQEVAFTMEKEGYGPRLVGDVSDETFGPSGARAGWRMYPKDQLAAIAQQLGTAYPWEGGMVTLAFSWPGSVDNVGLTFIPVGSTSDAVGEPFYYDAMMEQYSLDLEATTGVTSGNLLPLAEGGFTEVTPGEQQFEFGGVIGDCDRVLWGWPVEGAPNRIRVPVRAGYTTYSSMVCDGP